MTEYKASDRLLSYLGLAARARKLVSGTFACENALKKGQVKLLLVASNASDNTKKAVEDAAKFRNIPAFCMDAELGHAVGHTERKVIGVTDSNFTQAIMNDIDLNREG